MTKANYYAVENPYGNRTLGDCELHVFASRSERDAWVERDWARREPIGAGDARSVALDSNQCVLHGKADLPRSWQAGHRVWDYMALDSLDGRTASTWLAWA